MMLKDMLVHVDNAPGASTCVAVAATLAAAHGARLTGLCVRPVIEIPNLARTISGPALVDALNEAADTAAQRLEKLFEQGAAACPARRCLRITDHASDWVGTQGHCADLVVVGAGDVDEPGSRRLSGRILLGSGVPVMAIPERTSSTAPGQRVLIAWNASPEAIRAVHGAMPILQRAAAVEVLVVTAAPAAEGAAAPPGPSLVGHLAQHGVSATLKVLTMDEVHGVGASILARAKATGADLVVAGAFGRSRLREALIGSTTSLLLSRARVPVLLSH